MRELTLKIYYSDEGTDLQEDRTAFCAGEFSLADLLGRTKGQFTGAADHIDWTITDVAEPADQFDRLAETDSAMAPAGAFID